MRAPVLRATLAVALALAAPAALTLAAPDGLSDREAKDLERQLGEAAQASQWSRCAELMPQLARANDKKTWTLLLRCAERAPEGSDCPAALRGCAQVMTDRRVQEDVKKAALKSASVAVRRELVLHVAAQQDWPTLIDALKDRDEEVAARAAWKLVDARVEAAVEPLIAAMEKLDAGHGGIWDVCRNGLGKLLGQRLESAVEYRSRWEVVKGQGGLASVTPAAAPPVDAGPPAGGPLTSGVRLFGRPMECTRVVFVLDVSGSMLAVDPDQHDDPDIASRTRGGGESQTPPPGKTRIDRAKAELKRLIASLPESVKINIVAYSTNVAIWRDGEGGKAPQVHPMTAANKQAAAAFVDQFKADGVTVTDDALVRAYGVEGARCFYVLSDGAATHDGQTFMTAAEMLRVIDEYGKDRHVTIHTLGFQGADREMMQAVARHTGGQYSDIR